MASKKLEMCRMTGALLPAHRPAPPPDQCNLSLYATHLRGMTSQLPSVVGDVGSASFTVANAAVRVSLK